MKKLLFSGILIFSVIVLFAQKEVFNDVNAQVRDVKGFHAIKVSNAIDLQLSQSDKEAVAVSASKEEYRDKIKTVVENGVLKIWYDESKWYRTGNRKLKAYISFKNLDKLTASGASDVMVTGTIKSNDLTLDMSGASDFKGAVQSGNLNVELSGASDIVISGTTTDLKVGVSGASEFKGYDLQADNCVAEASGASDIRITVNKELYSTASGASSVHYKGSGVIRNIKTSGASSISKKD